MYFMYRTLYNILSVSKLTKELQCLVAFFPDICLFQDLYIGNVLKIGSEINRLHILKDCIRRRKLFTPIVHFYVS